MAGTITGAPVTDAAIIAEEAGRLAAPGPLLPVNAVAAGLTHDGSPEQQERYLPGLANGDLIAAWALAEPAGRWDLDATTTRAEVSGPTVRLEGTKCFVEAASDADVLLVTARGAAGPTQVLVPAGTPGMTIQPHRTLDLARTVATVRFDGVELPASAVVGQAGRAAAAIVRQWQVALTLQVAGLVGLTDRTMEFTLDYLQERYAFGRPVASFQAIKHRLADMAVWLQFSMAVADEAATAVDADVAAAARQVSVAKAYVGRRAVDVIHDCVQMTGGIAMTWDHDIHLYLRRALLDRELYGSPEQHKARLATALGV